MREWGGFSELLFSTGAKSVNRKLNRAWIPIAITFQDAGLRQLLIG